ncbi:TolC family protein [Xanthomarina sp. F2636L]|uniref:TolC family protein n=1 Tax=Xanthomarina sp. F2636L TaxID=2996018 RepID=UPI00225E567C|nr:TolC family protein [Xanthomarina sp. F2636L]MCX7551678.1 TolC family protein [Xanthomarina sp. F2636L]
MNKNIITTAILSVFISISAFSQEKKWTLEECVNYALENNITVKKGNNTILSNEYDIKETKGNFLPTVSANASQNLGIGNQELFDGQFVDRTSHSTNLGISARQTVFNGFRNTNLHKQAQINYELNQMELERIKDDISLNVVNGYLNVLFNKENLETAQAQLSFSQAQLERVTKLVDAGVQPRANIYDAVATSSRDEQNLTIAENNFDLSLLSLAQLLQLPFEGFQVDFEEVADPSSALLYKDVTPILEYAYQNRPEVKVAEKNIENSQISTEIAKSGFLPDVSLGYSFGSNVFYSNIAKDEATFFNQLNDQKAHSFNLNIAIPIFSGYDNKTNVAKTKIQQENSILDLEQTKLNLESNIQRAFTDAKAAYKTFEASKKSLEAQLLAFQNAQERFNMGALNTFDLEQTRIQLINAQSGLTNAKYDFVFKTKVLDFYLGKSLID